MNEVNEASPASPASETSGVEHVVMRNQCQGCQAGWPIEEHNPWPKGSKAMRFHAVEGGYKGEKVMCTKDRYIDT